MDTFTLDIDSVARQLQRLASDVTYWLFRANGGRYYDDFNAGDYVGMGWNSITLEDIDNYRGNVDALKSKVHDLFPDDKQPGSTAGQLQRFVYALKKDDIVLVPSENSERYLIGKITSEVYAETDEELLDDKRHSPYQKRRKVHWLGVIDRNSADPALYKLVYAGHTLSNADEYKDYINRALFDSYITDDKIHSTYLVNQLQDIDMLDQSTFTYSYAHIHKLLFPDEKLISKTNVQSLGPIEIVGGITCVVLVSGLLLFAFRKEIKKASFKFFGQSVTIEKGETKEESVWKIERERRELELKEREATDKHIAAQDEHISNLINNASKIQQFSEDAVSAMKNIDITTSTELISAIQKANRLTENSSSKNKPES
ncbi:hypothetical protein [Lacticaseibacillus manihotivorans]|uniref:Uncharacterized protein n=2 Tax=Lacticaseibacillus manihotivorans TaxID=88233 RepID=A0A0R1QN18_9LACO|nr:hypothetical protein [Lacticaseibacillus manihotivorans]KRL45726.1 hypothetical protein FD01_GL000605 [Lacticaseibacillus manihotivorans DSM 13343 = JCM 12514]QFQ91798.1 hypothetical protein LM010_10345 [Lacticaseibacillus manihotivorans]